MVNETPEQVTNARMLSSKSCVSVHTSKTPPSRLQYILVTVFRDFLRSFLKVPVPNGPFSFYIDSLPNLSDIINTQRVRILSKTNSPFSVRLYPETCLCRSQRVHSGRRSTVGLTCHSHLPHQRLTGEFRSSHLMSIRVLHKTRRGKQRYVVCQNGWLVDMFASYVEIANCFCLCCAWSLSMYPLRILRCYNVEWKHILIRDVLLRFRQSLKN